jgi:hypothetical protein
MHILNVLSSLSISLTRFPLLQSLYLFYLLTGSCGVDCYPIYGAMTVKVDKSVSQDAEARGAMYCAVLKIIFDTMGGNTLSDLTGIQSTELLFDRTGHYECDLGYYGLASVTKGGGGGAIDDEGGIPLVVTMSYVVAGGVIAFTAMFLYGRRKENRRTADGNSRSMMDMDTTIMDGAASVDMIRTGIEPLAQPSRPPPSPMSPYSTSSLYTGSHGADDTLLMANSAELWSDVDLETSELTQDESTYDNDILMPTDLETSNLHRRIDNLLMPSF